MNENVSDSKLSRIEEFVAKVGLFARQYPEFKHKIYSSEAPYSSFAKMVNVCFTAPNGKEQVAFCTMIDAVYNPCGEKEFDIELYKTLIDKLNCEFAKILSEKRMIDERDFFLHFNEFKKYVADAEPITILKDIEFQKFFKAFVGRQTKRHVEKFKDFIEYLLNNDYQGWVYIMVNNRIAHKIDFRSGMLSNADMFFIDACQNNEYEIVNTYELCSYPSQQVYEIKWK